jgi:hypothetical protein
VSGLYQLFRLMFLVYVTYRGWQSRREWAAGRPASMQAEIDRSNRYIAASFPARDRDASNDPSVDKEIP